MRAPALQPREPGHALVPPPLQVKLEVDAGRRPAFNLTLLAQPFAVSAQQLRRAPRASWDRHINCGRQCLADKTVSTVVTMLHRNRQLLGVAGADAIDDVKRIQRPASRPRRYRHAIIPALKLQRGSLNRKKSVAHSALRLQFKHRALGNLHDEREQVDIAEELLAHRRVKTVPDKARV